MARTTVRVTTHAILSFDLEVEDDDDAFARARQHIRELSSWFAAEYGHTRTVLGDGNMALSPPPLGATIRLVIDGEDHYGEY